MTTTSESGPEAHGPRLPEDLQARVDRLYGGLRRWHSELGADAWNASLLAALESLARDLAEARRAAPPREQLAKALERLVLSLDGLLNDAEGYDKSCVRAAFLGTKGEPPFDGLPAWKREDLLATELGARAAYYDAKAALADERAALGTDPR